MTYQCTKRPFDRIGDLGRIRATCALKKAVVPLVHELDLKLRAAEAVNDTVRQAEHVIRLARPKEVADLPSGYQLFWKEFPYPSQSSPSRLTSWRAFVRQELGIEL